MTHQCWTQLSPSLVGALPGRSPLMCDLLCNKTWLAYIYIYCAKVWSSGTVARLFQKVWIMNIGLVLFLAYAVSYCSQISTHSSCCQLQTTAETMLFSERVWALFTLCTYHIMNFVSNFLQKHQYKIIVFWWYLWFICRIKITSLGLISMRANSAVMFD